MSRRIPASSFDTNASPLTIAILLATHYDARIWPVAGDDGKIDDALCLLDHAQEAIEVAADVESGCDLDMAIGSCAADRRVVDALVRSAEQARAIAAVL